MLLRDEEILKLIKCERPLLSDLPHEAVLDFTKTSRVQSASLDLSVGCVFVPETKPDELGGVDTPMSSHVLEPGHTAVVETGEVLDLPADVAALGFPPSSVSARGLLTTNPGHVDAGYHGRLSLTIINMGRKSREIKRGDVILTLILFRLPKASRAPYGDRTHNPGGQSVVSKDRMSFLSQDFLQIQSRAEQVAKNEESKTRRWSVVAPALIAVVALVGSFGASYLQSNSQLSKDLEQQKIDMAVLKQQLNQKDLEQRIAKLESRP